MEYNTRYNPRNKQDETIELSAIKMSDNRMSSSGGRWLDVWYEYTQNATMHGISRITQQTNFMARRSVSRCITYANYAK